MEYNAALAAFKLCGRCPQSAQLLRIAARMNAGILAKIIGRRRDQPSVNSSSTAASTVQREHTTIWLAQNLWTEGDVWRWINEDTTVGGWVLKCCSRPERTGEETAATQCRGYGSVAVT
ncbi:hypothetical protein B0H19DRAFT_1084023 [Mycena capillaripes]|nr:hypothetical protein B0H19DRAFT_1084023 [Mycena capillaripes]